MSVVDKSGRLETADQPPDFFFNLLRTLLYLIALGSDEVSSGFIILNYRFLISIHGYNGRLWRKLEMELLALLIC